MSNEVTNEQTPQEENKAAVGPSELNAGLGKEGQHEPDKERIPRRLAQKRTCACADAARKQKLE